MAVGVPVAGSSSGSNGGPLTPATLAGQSIVTGDTVFICAIFYANTGTAPTTITWPGADANFTAFTQVQAVQIKDAAGTVKGIAGWAWARALQNVGGGVTRTVSANGTTGASSGAIANIIKVPGCISTGDPYEAESANNPNYTATVDWPAATMSRSSTGGSVIILLNSDNVNMGTPATWTVVTSNASTQGLDSALEVDYRLPGATGTYDPANATMAANQNLGWATFHIIFTDTAGGPTTHFGATSLPITFNRVVAGSKKTFSTLALPITFSSTTQGRRKALGQIAFPITFSKAVQAQRKTFSQILSPFTFGKAVQAQRKTFGQASLPLIFGKEIIGRRSTFGQTSLPLIFGKESAGSRKTFGQVSLPLIFGKDIAGSRKAFGQLSLPVTVSIFTAGDVSTGPVTHFGQVALPLTFGKQVAAQRETFAQIVAPFIFGANSQGQRETFSELDFPIVFEAAVESGRLTTYGVVDLDLILTINTAGIERLAGVILNNAVALYLGETEVLAVYVGSEQVW